MKKVAIIGAGACGLACGYQLSLLSNLAITIFEANNKIGKKINISGNGKGNVSNQNIVSTSYKNGTFVKNILQEDVSGLLNAIGILLRTDNMGRIYPINERALDVSEAFNYFLAPYVKFNKVNKLEKINNLYKINDELFDYVVIAIGSKIENKNYDDSFLNSLNFENVPFENTLGPLLIRDNIGTFRRKAEVTLLENDQIIYQEFGEVQFKDNILSGICIFNCSFFMEQNKVYTIKFDPFKENIDSFLQKDLPSLNGLLPKELLKYIFKGKKNLSKNEIKKLLNNITFPIVRKMPGQVQRGGISLNEITENLEAKKYPNIYLGGEMLDVDALSGGFNLHFAFSCGLKIAKDIALKEEKII